MEKLNYEIITKPAYRAIGMKWEGPYSEIKELKEVINTMSTRAGELEHAVEPEVQLGMSYHLRPDGFIHYSVFEVELKQEIPDEMEEIIVPEMQYLKVQHEKGKDFGHTYSKIYQWFKESDYIPYTEQNVEYYDDLPIKHERYPIDRDLNDPHFEILIPVIKHHLGQ
ncbi:GyrI-like domain-containing protein [Sutcliffiella deserti]|uniref:GyrI-like domain-containing protein n=1 Tax=Sutcliffiella deserti TaxID=2875501 RepID=UPI001CBDDF88|nr:GyrI-like domain-containing protein [Sutcliffiella deserti]